MSFCESLLGQKGKSGPEDQKQMALDTLQVLFDRRTAYDAVNKEIKGLNPDFPSLVTVVDPKIETAVVKLLDAILGDFVASYFLYECWHMKDGGKIVENEVEWPIRSMDDVRAYVMRNAGAK